MTWALAHHLTEKGGGLTRPVPKGGQQSSELNSGAPGSPAPRAQRRTWVLPGRAGEWPQGVGCNPQVDKGFPAMGRKGCEG